MLVHTYWRFFSIVTVHRPRISTFLFQPDIRLYIIRRQSKVSDDSLKYQSHIPKRRFVNAAAICYSGAGVPTHLMDPS